MSYLPFSDQNAASSTLSNLTVYKQQIVIPTSGAPLNYLLFTTESNMGQFTPTAVWFHVDDNSGVATLTFTCSIGHNGPATYDNICASAVRGSATLALQLQQFKAVNFATRIATSYYAGYATPANVATGVYARVTATPASQITGTFFVGGYYTGMEAYT